MFVVAFKNVDRVTIFECRASLGIVRWDAVNIDLNMARVWLIIQTKRWPSYRLVKGNCRANIMTLMIHAHDCGDITVYYSLIFNHLFGQTIGTSTGDASTPKAYIFPYCLKIIYLQKTNMLVFWSRASHFKHIRMPYLCIVGPEKCSDRGGTGEILFAWRNVRQSSI